MLRSVYVLVAAAMLTAATPQMLPVPDGPVAQAHKSVVFVAEDLRNGGVLGVAQGVKEAVARIGWTMRILDAKGSDSGRLSALGQALAMRPDGIILGGMDARAISGQLPDFAQSRLPVVAWHGGAYPGVIAGTPVLLNVTTEPVAVARAAADWVIQHAGAHAGVVIFTDSHFTIATAKAQAMASAIRDCGNCELLQISDIAISQSSRDTPQQVRQLLARYGRRWTHTLAINDIYFDHATPVFAEAGLAAKGAMSCVSAGDGSASAYMRILAGTYQTATVAEPLNWQGWQLVDALNRRFAGQPLPDYVLPAHLVTPDNVLHDGGARSLYDPDNHYRDRYLQLWKR